jgi:hypothetical protein
VHPERFHEEVVVAYDTTIAIFRADIDEFPSGRKDYPEFRIFFPDDFPEFEPVYIGHFDIAYDGVETGVAQKDF